MRGRFITFEGGEGAGKSTQAQALGSHLTSLGLAVLLSREPGGTPFAEEVRAFLLARPAAAGTPLAEALIFWAARVDHVERKLAPALVAGTWVICDRFADSTRAYQGAADGAPASTLERLEPVLLGDLRPALTLVLDCPAEIGLRRAEARREQENSPGDQDRFERRDLAFHQRLRSGYLAIAAREPQRCVVLDATRPAAETSAEIRSLLQARFGVG